MAEASAKKVGFFKGVRKEFKKIIWPNKQTVTRNTYVVIVTVLALGAVIAAIDTGFQFLIFDLLLGNL